MTVHCTLSYTDECNIDHERYISGPDYQSCIKQVQHLADQNIDLWSGIHLSNEHDEELLPACGSWF